MEVSKLKLAVFHKCKTLQSPQFIAALFVGFELAPFHKHTITVETVGDGSSTHGAGRPQWMSNSQVL